MEVVPVRRSTSRVSRCLAAASILVNPSIFDRHKKKCGNHDAIKWTVKKNLGTSPWPRPQVSEQKKEKSQLRRKKEPYPHMENWRQPTVPRCWRNAGAVGRKTNYVQQRRVGEQLVASSSDVRGWAMAHAPMAARQEKSNVDVDCSETE